MLSRLACHGVARQHLRRLMTDASAEAEVGILAFANDAPGFSAVLKHRFSDFVVAEVGSDGTVAQLFQAGLPPAASAAVARSDGGEPPAGGARWRTPPAPRAVPAAAPPDFDAAAAAARFEPLVGAADAAALQQWLATAVRAEPSPPPLCFSPLAAKGARAALHALVGELLPWAESDTAEAQGDGDGGGGCLGGAPRAVRLHARAGSVVRARPRAAAAGPRARRAPPRARPCLLARWLYQLHCQRAVRRRGPHLLIACVALRQLLHRSTRSSCATAGHLSCAACQLRSRWRLRGRRSLAWLPSWGPLWKKLRCVPHQVLKRTRPSA
jgi:hypothetical protein